MEPSVAIAGVGMVPFGSHRERSVEQQGQAAVVAALADAGLSKDAIEEVFCGSGYGGPLIGQRVLRGLGLTGPPVTNVENACSSSAAAVRLAFRAVASGAVETALAFGVDKLTSFGRGPLPLEGSDPDVGQGMTMPAVYAMRAQRYLTQHGADREQLAKVSVKARRNGAANPYAHLRKPVSVEEVLGSRMIADPLTLFMCSPMSDGAAAVVVTSARRARQGPKPPVWIRASVLQSGRYEPGPSQLATAELTVRTSHLAYEQADIGPADVDLAEVHDAFAIAELMYYEALGLCEPGAGADMLERGRTEVGGDVPVNPSGGLLARGHPIGATGAAQICEAVWQLRGEATGRQVDRPRVALTHCTGGGMAGVDHGACTIHVLSR